LQNTRKFKYTHFPFSPARWPFFYGWMIVVCAVVGLVASVPGQTTGMAVFIESLMDALSLKRVEVSEAYMWGTIASSLFLPFAGKMFDRFGARVLSCVSAVGLGVTLLGLSEVDHLVAYARELLSTDSLALTMTVLTVGFFFLRFWGQGVLAMISRAMLGKWFDRRRGLASGIAGVLTSGAFAASPRILAEMNDHWSWRGTWQVLAIGIGVGVAVFGWLFYRDNPEECGLRMDGVPAPEESKEEEVDTGKSYTVSEALRTYSFWIINLVLSAMGMLYTAMTFHIVALGASVGLGKADTVSIFMPKAAVAIVVTLVGGWLLDRIRVRYLLVASVAGLTLGTLALCSASFGETWGRWLFILGYGLPGGLFSVLSTVVWPRYFGRKHLGAITGVNFSSMVLASALGPHLFSLSEESTGSFDTAIYLSATLCATLLVFTFWVQNPRRDP